MLYNMKEILSVAKEHKFAIPAFNVADWSMFLGIMDECEATNSPVIIEIHPDELAFEGPDMVGAIRQRALKSKVPVCIHLDHCSNFGTIKQSSVVSHLLCSMEHLFHSKKILQVLKK